MNIRNKFWSTQDPGQKPFSFKIGFVFNVNVIYFFRLGQVIKGWDEGFATMKLGEEAVLTCTGDYAYG
jgi:peptidylprolyl isomerase